VLLLLFAGQIYAIIPIKAASAVRFFVKKPLFCVINSDFAPFVSLIRAFFRNFAANIQLIFIITSKL